MLLRGWGNLQRFTADLMHCSAGVLFNVVRLIMACPTRPEARMVNVTSTVPASLGLEDRPLDS
jgi:hypothetical protein